MGDLPSQTQRAEEATGCPRVRYKEGTASDKFKWHSERHCFNRLLEPELCQGWYRIRSTHHFLRTRMDRDLIPTSLLFNHACPPCCAVAGSNEILYTKHLPLTTVPNSQGTPNNSFCYYYEEWNCVMGSDLDRDCLKWAPVSVVNIRHTP